MDLQNLRHPLVFVRLALLCAALAGCQSGAPRSTDSPVVFSFATVGDSRQEPHRPGNTAQDERWLQSTALFSRILHEVELRRPQALVFNGDMIYGYSTDPAVIDRQYAFWRGMVAGLMERGTYVLPVPGNHEVQVPQPKAGGGTVKRATAAQEDAWRANMGDLILDARLWRKISGISPAAWNPDFAPPVGRDGITTDQRQLSYSFDAGAIHFAIINTDPAGFDESAPAAWLEGDFAAAKARGARHFFVFGHKPAFTYVPQRGAMQAKVKEKEDGFASRPELRDRFWDLVEAYGATYFCGHQHVYHASQPRKGAGGRAWQVIVGTAGSPLTVAPGQSDNPFDVMYAWAEVGVHANGNVDVVVRGFAFADAPTVELERWTIAPR